MFAINLSTEKPKYSVSITQANNGFAVSVEEVMSRKAPLSQEEAQRRIGKFLKGMEEGLGNNEKFQDPMLSKLLDEAKDEEIEKNNVVGLHVFYTYTELTNFLSTIFIEDKKDLPF
jgi:hypothetical protein